MSQWAVQNTDGWLFWHIVDATDYVTPETGLVSTDIGVNLCYSTSSVMSKYALGAGDWVELGVGKYKLNMGAGEFAASGAYLVEVGGVAGGLSTARTIVDVLPYSLNNLSTAVSATLDDTGTSGVVLNSLTTAGKAAVEAEVIDALYNGDAGHAQVPGSVKGDVTLIRQDTETDGVLIASAAQNAVADTVLDEAMSGHTTSGTLGNYMRAMVRALTGYVDTAIATGVMSVHDGKDAGDAELMTLTLADDGTTVTRTPSVEP